MSSRMLALDGDFCNAIGVGLQQPAQPFTLKPDKTSVRILAGNRIGCPRRPW